MNHKIAVIGLGYVGLPLAVAFAKHLEVIGFDINEEKIQLYKQGIDVTSEVGTEQLKKSTVHFTSNPTELEEASFHIIAVPTPINSDKTPDLTPIIKSSELVGRHLKKGSIVVYESTVYPGTTEEICVPILEKESGLTYNVDFKVGYSPERINPGDKVHQLHNIIKIVSGCDTETLNIIADVYNLVVEVGTYKASSIKVAEAAKVIENSQRDINIAFMNELAMVFNKMDIDTNEVLAAAKTKWNFLDFQPGLVGGHCIGVDPYYFIYKAEQLGYHSQIILAGRMVNDGMGKYIAAQTIKMLIKAKKQVNGAKIAVLGLTFKENCPDVRNSKVNDIIQELKEYGVEIIAHDPLADEKEVLGTYNQTLIPLNKIRDVDAVIVAVAHKEYITLDKKEFQSMFKPLSQGEQGVLIDVKGIIKHHEPYVYWRL